MATNITSFYNFLMYDIADKRTNHWPLITSPVPLLILVATYLYAILIWGPKFMEKRKPYDLKNIIAVYNVGQIIACIVIFYGVLTSGWTTTYSLGCQALDLSVNQETMRMANFIWWTMILKSIELIETVFFVLRKKYNQVSFLHIYHHVSTLALAWFCTKYSPGGMTSFSILPNCLVHIAMYTYYLLALGGPSWQSRISKFKKYITIIQMIQFCIILAHTFQALKPNCNEAPRFLVYFYIPNIALIFYLFYDFYQKAYKGAKKHVA